MKASCRTLQITVCSPVHQCGTVQSRGCQAHPRVWGCTPFQEGKHCRQGWRFHLQAHWENASGVPCGADTHQHAPHHSCGQGSPVPQGEEPTAETSGIVVVGTQPGAALSALIKPTQPQACKFSLTPFKSKLWNCTWATFGCVPKLPMVTEKRSPDHPGFPLASSLPLLEMLPPLVM